MFPLTIARALLTCEKAKENKIDRTVHTEKSHTVSAAPSTALPPPYPAVRRGMLLFCLAILLGRPESVNGPPEGRVKVNLKYTYGRPATTTSGQPS